MSAKKPAAKKPVGDDKKATTIDANETPMPVKSSKSENQHNARQITHAPQPAMRSPNAAREPVPVARNAKRPLSDARRYVAGSTKGK